jgi:hypothetical protein
LKKIIFGTTGWTFPFMRGYRDQEKAVANFILAEMLDNDATLKSQEIERRLRDDTLLVPVEDTSISEISDEVEQEINQEDSHFLEVAPLPGGGQGRKAN